MIFNKVEFQSDMKCTRNHLHLARTTRPLRKKQALRTCDTRNKEKLALLFIVKIQLRVFYICSVFIIIILARLSPSPRRQWFCPKEEELVSFCRLPTSLHNRLKDLNYHKSLLILPGFEIDCSVSAPILMHFEPFGVSPTQHTNPDKMSLPLLNLIFAPVRTRKRWALRFRSALYYTLRVACWSKRDPSFWHCFFHREFFLDFIFHFLTNFIDFFVSY